MNKYFIFVSDKPLDTMAIERLGHCYEDMYELRMLKPNVGYFLSPEEDEEKVKAYLKRLPYRMYCMLSPFADEFIFGLAESHFPFFPNELIHPSDALFKRISFGDYSFFPSLKDYFSLISGELMETAGAYLRCGCNGLRAAEALCVHRNTFNYRLNAFILASGLDIRDYHNALLLEIYFQFTNRFH